MNEKMFKSSSTYRFVKARVDGLLQNMQKYVLNWQTKHPHLQGNTSLVAIATLPVDDPRDDIAIFSACDVIVSHEQDASEHDIIRCYVRESQRLGDIECLLEALDEQRGTEQDLRSLQHIQNLESRTKH